MKSTYVQDFDLLCDRAHIYPMIQKSVNKNSHIWITVHVQCYNPSMVWQKFDRFKRLVCRRDRLLVKFSGVFCKVANIPILWTNLYFQIELAAVRRCFWVCIHYQLAWSDSWFLQHSRHIYRLWVLLLLLGWVLVDKENLLYLWRFLELVETIETLFSWPTLKHDHCWHLFSVASGQWADSYTLQAVGIFATGKSLHWFVSCPFSSTASLDHFWFQSLPDGFTRKAALLKVFIFYEK